MNEDQRSDFRKGHVGMVYQQPNWIKSLTVLENVAFPLVLMGKIKAETLENLRQRKPQDVIIHAVSGMLPQNRLKDKMLSRLHVFEEETHTFKDKFNKQ